MINTESQEMTLLRQRLTDTEAELARAKNVIERQAGAIIDVDLKTYHAMKQLLTANDVFRDSIGHDPMRVNILEILNDVRRFAKHRFESAGIIATAELAPNGEHDASHDIPKRVESTSQRHTGNSRFP